MTFSPGTGLPIIPEHDATGSTASLYQEVRRVTHLPILPNVFAAVGNSNSALNMYWMLWRAIIDNGTLPQALISMIQYTVAENNNCEYCSAGHEMTCRALGVDEKTLENLVKDLDSVNPQRVRAIIEFAIKVARRSQQLERKDYDLVRDQGVSDEEIAEIILITAIQCAGDIVADAFKVEVDTVPEHLLGLDAESGVQPG